MKKDNPQRDAQAVFLSPWWLHGPHLQSCFNPLFPPIAKTWLTWEQLELPDGDFLDLCWGGAANPAKIVILLHGLEGSVRSHYIQSMLDSVTSMGWRAVIMHFRTCSGRLNRLPRSYHAGEIGDLSYLIEVVRARYPQAVISAIGFSLGGNVLLHYLCKQSQAPLHSAIAVSVPFELDRCASYLCRLYQWVLLRTMKAKAFAKIKAGYDMPISQKELRVIHNFRQFDDAVTAPLHGFCGVKDYYTRVSIRGCLKKINCPTLIIHALNDPFVPADCVPTLSEVSTTTQLELYQQGGHVGFIQGKPWRPIYWLNQRIIDFLKNPLA